MRGGLLVFRQRMDDVHAPLPAGCLEFLRNQIFSVLLKVHTQLPIIDSERETLTRVQKGHYALRKGDSRWVTSTPVSSRTEETVDHFRSPQREGDRAQLRSKCHYDSQFYSEF